MFLAHFVDDVYDARSAYTCMCCSAFPLSLCTGILQCKSADTLDNAGDAFQLAKTAFTKATKSVTDAAGRLIPRAEDTPEQAQWRDDDRRLNQDPFSRSRPQSRSPYSRGGELYRPEDDSFFGGLMGRTGSSILLPELRLLLC